MLTERQRDVLNFVVRYQRAQGCSPSYVEVAAEMGLASKGNVCRLIDQLEARGFVRRQPDQARAIRVLRLPNGAAAQAPARAPTDTRIPIYRASDHAVMGYLPEYPHE